MERPPIPHPAGPGDLDRLVEIASFSYPLEAHLAAVRLRTEGVRVHLSGEHAAGLLTGVGGVRLWVREFDRARAVECLAPLDQKTAAPRRSAYFVTADLDAPRCPRCGGLALEAERAHGLFFVFLWLRFWGVRDLFRPHLRCRLCKARWKPALGEQDRSKKSVPARLFED